MRKLFFFLLLALPFFILQSQTPPAEDGAVTTYNWPRVAPSSDVYALRVNGEESFVYYTDDGSFSAFECDGEVIVEVEMPRTPPEVRILPLSLGIEPEIDGSRLTFTMSPGQKALVEIFEWEQLFIYANAPVKEKPEPDAEGVHYFAAGQWYEVGELQLQQGELLYIEGGAVVSGRIRAYNADDITISGNGVLNGAYYREYGEGGHFVSLGGCTGVTVEDIIMVNTPGWMLVFYECEDVQVSGIKQISDGHGSDGIDIVASRNVRIEDCLLSNGDDCIVVKSRVQRHFRDSVDSTGKGAQNIRVERCAVQANGGGQAFEIGHELMIDPVSDISFKDCDVLGVHGQGGVFGIHNCDEATVSNVLYEDIRVDHYYNKLIDFRIIKSRWSRQPDAGHVKNVTLRNIHVTNNIYNQGYSISLIGGYDAEHQIENVLIEDFYINGKKITNADELDLYLKQVDGFKIK